MKVFLAFLISLICASVATAADNTFADKLDLKPLETVAVQHAQTVKTLDSFSRQTITSITGRSTLDGHSAIFTVFDISFRPEAYRERNLIKIKHVPLREDFRLLENISDAEKERIVKEGRISLTFWQKPEVQKLMMELQAQAVHKADAIQQLNAAASTLAALCRQQPDFPPAAVLSPSGKDPNDHKWHPLAEVVGNVPKLVESLKAQGMTPPPALAGYDGKGETFGGLIDAAFDMMNAWRDNDAASVNKQVAALAQLLPQVSPSTYPSPTVLKTEVVYNRLAKLTIPGAAFYFMAFVFFLMSARSGVNSLRLWGLRLFTIGLLVHTAGIAIRWWLVASQHGSWFDGIPIKNQFESVLMSAWFGAVVGYILEMRSSRGIYGAAASFVGWLSLILIFSAPFVAGRDIGGEIGQVAGVLMSFWLYIHVTMVTASYALIGMGFCLSAWWLVKYYADHGALSRRHAQQLDDDGARGFDVVVPAGATAGAMTGAGGPAMGGGAAALGFGRTLGMMLFLGGATGGPPVSSPQIKEHGRAAHGTSAKSESFLATLDACNLVVLQLAFWILGAGIICGAIWADQSWGRPWGWDPKETFALVTWIVYLIVVHVRVATVDKAWWTAVLSVIGFFVMLFNWIGVNFFLVGLHSYA